MKNKFKKQKGYVTLFLVIIVGVITTAMVLTVLNDGLSSASTGLSFTERYRARSFANACAEKALYRIHNGDITDSENNRLDPIIFHDNEECTYSAFIDGSSFRINAIGISESSHVIMVVTGTLSNGEIAISSWTTNGSTGVSGGDYIPGGLLPGGTGGIVDNTPPEITLVGEAEVSIELGKVYTDGGATASDNIDGDITSSIVTSNPVDTSIQGTYTVTYNVSDSSGNPATEVTRTVNVVSS